MEISLSPKIKFVLKTEKCFWSKFLQLGCSFKRAIVALQIQKYIQYIVKLYISVYQILLKILF